MNETSLWTGLFRALKHRNFRIFFIGQGASLLGTWIQQTGEIWLAWRLTHSSLALGWVGFAGQFPTFLLAPLAGAWVDRVNKHRVVIAAQVLEMLQAFALALLVLTHHITFPILIALSLIGGIFDALEIPARQSFVIDMVESPADLGNAIALNSSLVNLARLIGPALSGLLIAAVGEGWCFFINGSSYLAVITSLLVMRFKENKSPVVQDRPLAQSFWEGFRYALSSLPMTTLLSTLAMISLASSSYTVLIPVFATHVLHGGPHTLGFLMAASGLGALSAALMLASRKTVVGLGRLIALGIVLQGSGLLIFSLSHWFWLSWAAMTVTGYGMMTGTASINTMLQTIVDPKMRGRIMSFFTMAFIGMAPLGNLAGGWMASHIGASLSVRIAGGVCYAVALLYALRLPRLREHIRPIYREQGILPGEKPVLPEMAAGLQAASSTIKPRG